MLPCVGTFCLGSTLQVFWSNHSQQEKFSVIASSGPTWSATARELLVIWRFCRGQYLHLMHAKGSKRTICKQQILRSCPQKIAGEMMFCLQFVSNTSNPESKHRNMHAIQRAIQSIHAWQIVSLTWLRHKPHRLESNSFHASTVGQYNFLSWFLCVAFISDECTR